MSDWDGIYYDSAKAIREKQEREAREKSERLARINAQLGPAVRQAERGDLAAMRRVIELLAERDGLRIYWREPTGEAYGYALGTSGMVIPPIRSATDFAVGIHEWGHTQSERCRGGDHQPQADGRWHLCLRCEQLAWEKAMTVITFSREMFAELQRGLSSYRRRISGPATAVAAVDKTKSFSTYADLRLRKARLDYMDARLARHGRN